ncbi:hypothetical protein BKA80DRAFT_278728 [Phyllosticta citrichinensis]
MPDPGSTKASRHTELVDSKFSRILSQTKNMYELRHIPGRGTAVFTTRDICRGTFIMTESPILVMEKGMDASEDEARQCGAHDES